MRSLEEQHQVFESLLSIEVTLGTEMTGKNFDKWMKDAGVIDGKDITTTMTGIAFSKVVGYVPSLYKKH